MVLHLIIFYNSYHCAIKERYNITTENELPEKFFQDIKLQEQKIKISGMRIVRILIQNIKQGRCDHIE